MAQDLHAFVGHLEDKFQSRIDAQDNGRQPADHTEREWFMDFIES